MEKGKDPKFDRDFEKEVIGYNEKKYSQNQNEYRDLITLLLDKPSINVNKCGADIPALHIAAKNNNKDIKYHIPWMWYFIVI